MDSRIFIKEAAALMEDIKTFQVAYLSPEDEMAQGTVLQKRITNAFASLQNPTLPSAYKLRDVAVGAGFSIKSEKLHWLTTFESIRA